MWGFETISIPTLLGGENYFANKASEPFASVVKMSTVQVLHSFAMNLNW